MIRVKFKNSISLNSKNVKEVKIMDNFIFENGTKVKKIITTNGGYDFLKIIYLFSKTFFSYSLTPSNQESPAPLPVFSQ